MGPKTTDILAQQQFSEDLQRCSWTDGTSSDMVAYHDHEWGIACHDSDRLFELFSLEIMQAGLSWAGVIRKRQCLNRAFHGFHIAKVASMRHEIATLMENPNIIRNHRKITAIVHNASVIENLDVSFDTYMWSFDSSLPIINRPEDYQLLPNSSPLSVQISSNMKKAGFTFIGPVTIYSFMQASGMINDHERGCFLCPPDGSSSAATDGGQIQLP